MCMCIGFLVHKFTPFLQYSHMHTVSGAIAQARVRMYAENVKRMGLFHIQK